MFPNRRPYILPKAKQLAQLKYHQLVPEHRLQTHKEEVHDTIQSVAVCLAEVIVHHKSISY